MLALTVILPLAARCELPGELEDALKQARAFHRLLVLVFLDESGSKAESSPGALECAAWQEQIAPHQQKILHLAKNYSLLRRFSIRDLPSFIVLDGEGREVGRVENQRGLGSAQRRLRDLLDAAERSSECTERLKKDPGDAEALYWVGAHEWNRGARVSAAERFEKVVTLGTQLHLGPKDLTADALRLLGEAHLELSRFTEAEDSFRRSLTRQGSPEQRSQAALGLGRSLRRQGKAREAICALEAHFLPATSEPSLDEALFMLGYLYTELGENEKAARSFHTVIEQFPSTDCAHRAELYRIKARRPPITGVAEAVSTASLSRSRSGDERLKVEKYSE